MNRIRSAVALSALAVGTSSIAAPPNEMNWWQAMDNYVDSFEMMSGEDSDAVTGHFTMRWTEPFARTEFTAVSMSDSDGVDGAGFVVWNKESARPEFREVVLTPEGQSMMHGFMKDVTDQTITWEATEWNQDGEVRKFRIEDTFDETGMKRKATVLSGKKMPERFEWRRRNFFLEHCPVAEALVGTWEMEENGGTTVTEIKFGAGRRSLHATTYAIDADGNKTAEGSGMWRYDAGSDRVVAQVEGGDGVGAWARPTFSHEGDQHTITFDWRGRDQFNNPLSVSVTETLEGDTRTRRITGFEFMRSSPPGMAEFMKQMPPQVMTRRK